MAVYKKSIPLVIILLICSFVLGGCKGSNPEITTSITLSNITEEEYNQITESNKPEGATINDLKKLYVDAKITNSKKATERVIIIPDIYIIDRYDRVRSTSGGSWTQNNIKTEDFAESYEYVIFDIRGLGEQDIRSLYSKSEIYIAYRLNSSDLVEKRVVIGTNMLINK